MAERKSDKHEQNLLSLKSIKTNKKVYDRLTFNIFH